MDPIRIIIVDDEPPARDELKYLLESSCENIEVVGCCENTSEAKSILKEKSCDLLFLDIEMPEESGIDFARWLHTQGTMPYIIFVTAFDQFALDAFELNATDYLLKPVAASRLQKAIEKVEQWIRGEKNSSSAFREQLSKISQSIGQRITLSAGEKLVPLEFKEVIAATVIEKNTVVYTDRGEFSYPGTLVELEHQLSSEQFFRCHKSYLINLTAIESIDIWFNGGLQLKLRGFETVVPVSRNYAKDFKKAINFR